MGKLTIRNRMTELTVAMTVEGASMEAVTKQDSSNALTYVEGSLYTTDETRSFLGNISGRKDKSGMKYTTSNMSLDTIPIAQQMLATIVDEIDGKEVPSTQEGGEA